MDKWWLLLDFLARLEPTVERPTIELVFFEKLPDDETAVRLSKRLGWPVPTYKIGRILKAIRERLGDEFKLSLPHDDVEQRERSVENGDA